MTMMLETNFNNYVLFDVQANKSTVRAKQDHKNGLNKYNPHKHPFENIFRGSDNLSHIRTFSIQ